MKHLSVIISVLFSILCIGCSKEDFDDGKTNDIQNKHSLRLLVYTPTSETVLSTDLPGNIEAYLFKEGVLSDVYKNLTVDKNGYTTISSLAEEGQIYFFVNTGKLLNGITEEIGRLKETELLATTILLCLSSSRWRETGDDRKGRLNRKPGEYHPSIAYTGHCQSRLKHS